MTKKTPYYIISSLGLFLSTTLTVLAQNEGYQLLAPIPTITNKTPSFVEFLKGIFVAGVGLAIVGAVMMIIIGALGYVMAAVPSAKADGKKKMTDALFGLLIILVSTVILVTINPDLMRTGLNLAKLSPPQLNGSVYYRNGTYGGQFPTRAECEAGGSYTCTEQIPTQSPTGKPPEYCQAVFGGTDPGNYLACYTTISACEASPCQNGIPFSCQCVTYFRP
jgi:hypothetical protein